MGSNGMVADEHVEELKRRLEATDTEIRRLGDYASARAAVVGLARRFMLWVFRTVTLLGSLFGGDRFTGRQSDYWLHVDGTIYVPRSEPIDLHEPETYKRVCHELGHRYDQLEDGVWFGLAYVLDGGARATYEYRGYGLQFAAERRVEGQLREGWPEHVAEMLSGPSYAWAADYEVARQALERIAESVRSGRLERTYDPKWASRAGHLPTLHDPQE